MLRLTLSLLLTFGSVSALTPKQPAPRFTLADSAGQPWSLAAHLGRERLLLLAAPSIAELDGWARQAALLANYDLRVVALLLPGDARLNRPPSPALTLLADPGGRVAARVGRAALIGKDGGVKASYATPPSLTAVLALIDTMPMRQQERRSRGQ